MVRTAPLLGTAGSSWTRDRYGGAATKRTMTHTLQWFKTCSTMNSTRFRYLVETVLSSSMKSSGLGLKELTTSGRAYTCVFHCTDFEVTISFEPGDSHWVVAVQTLANGHLSDWDDNIATPRLSDLNTMFMSAVTDDDRREASRAFSHVHTLDEDEATLLRYGRELRLILPKYIELNIRRR